MTSSYITDLLAQPAAVRATLNNLAFDDPAMAVAADLWQRQPWKRIVLTAMGGSYYALTPFHYALIAAGQPVVTVEASELLYYWPPLDADTLLVIVSQSGRSVELLKLLEQTNDGPARLAITNTADSPLAGASDATLLTVAGEEWTVSCKTYVAALAALALLAARVTMPEQFESINAALLAGADAMEQYLATLEQQVNTLDALVGDARPLMVLGRGPSLAAVGTGAMIIKEAAKVQAEGMSTAAFRHGPFEMVAPGLVALIYEGDERTADLNRRMAQDIVGAGGRAILASPREPTELRGVELVRLPVVDPVAQPLVEILPMQMLSVALARRYGREPGRFIHIGKVTTDE